MGSTGPPGGPGATDAEFFEREVRPLLATHCRKCHGPEQQKGGLRLDSRAAILAGGDSGPAVVPGHPEDSLLIEAVRQGDLVRMPPRSRLPEREIAVLTRWVAGGLPWPAEGDRQTAAYQKGFDLPARRAAHWAWRPIQVPGPPTVRDESWPRGPVDSFVLSRLERRGLHPAPDADKRTLMRRVTFDLIGLPPTPEEVDAFVADDAPGAFARVVDRLLASPHFGERWGRHWLDLARYAESRGHEFDATIPNAWQYRDYVIRALNADVPYDRFVTEHIAGDLLADPRRDPSTGANESILGTGFWFLGEEVHSPVDLRQDEADRVDNRIDVMTKAFLGLTVACARCHDHKFDAISQRDYYALAGFLISSSYRQVRFETLDRERCVARELDRLRESARARLFGAAARAQRPTLDRLADYLMTARGAILGGAGPASTSPVGDCTADLARRHRLGPAILARWVDELREARADARHPLHAFALVAHDPEADHPAGFARVLASILGNDLARRSRADEAAAPARVVVDYAGARAEGWLQDGSSFGTRPARPGEVWLDGTLEKPALRILDRAAARRDVAWAALKSTGDTERDHGRLGTWDRSGQTLRTPEFTLDSGRLWYLVRGAGRAYAAVDSHLIIAGPLHGALLTEWKGDDGDRWRWVAHDLSAYRGHRLHVELSPAGPGELAIAQVVDSERPPADPESVNGSLLAALVAARVDSPGAMARVYQTLLLDVSRRMGRDAIAGSTDAVDLAHLADWLVQDPGLFGGPDGILWKEWRDELGRIVEEQAGLIRRVPPESHAAPAMLDGNGVDAPLLIRGSARTPGPPVPRRFLEAIAGPEPIQAGPGSGRLELARQMVAPSNPLTARVIVNRIWHHLFGRGLVASVDNFGVLGEPPSHPELLDYLADRFVREGWSMKRLIRALVLSRTYQMSSRPTSSAEELDPEDLLLHRMRLRRLEGEALRDAILAVSGRLDRRPYGPSVPVALTPFLQGRGRPKDGPLDGAGRRSVYLGVRRNFLSPMLLAFDMPIPFSCVGRRHVSNVPAQALILMNDPFVVEQAAAWAGRVLAPAGPAPEPRIAALYLAAFARPPADRELADALEFLRRQGRELGPAPDRWQGDARVWADLAHILFNSKEFLFVE